MSGKVLDDFQRRRQLHEALEALGRTSTELELWTQVREIAAQYPPALVLAAIRRFLDTSSSQLRGGLGRLATLLPREETVALLLQEARNRGNPTGARLTAALILERFLEVSVPPGLMSDLQNPEVVVQQSLEEALAEARTHRHVLLEYVQQMRRETEEVAHLVMGLLERFPPREQIPLLRLIAHDARIGVARTAIQRLGRLRASEALMPAMRALHSLAINLPPDRADLAERSLRKLRFAAGVAFQPQAADGWRALASPVDPQAEQQIWFIYTAPDHPDATTPSEIDAPPRTLLLGLRLNHATGLVDAFAHEGLSREQLPPPRQVGEFMSIALADGVTSLFLELDPGRGQQQLRRALEVHWQREVWHPLPPEYTLYAEFLWSWQAGSHEGRAPGVPGYQVPDPGSGFDGLQALEAATARLLRHPAMVGWIPMAPAIQEALGQLDTHADAQALARTAAELRERLFPAQREAELQDRLATALTAQAEWLQVAGFSALARDAARVASSLRQLPLAEHPLPSLMVQMGLSILVNRARSSTSVPTPP